MSLSRTMWQIVVLAMLTSSGAASAASLRHTVVVSDLHVGAGKDAQGKWKPIEDFRWQEDFESFLKHVSKESSDQADLVLAGDVFELWQSPTMTCSSDRSKAACVVPDCQEDDNNDGCSEAEALARFKYILAQHPKFITAIRAFAARGSNTVHFIPGNHDAALFFPALQAELNSQLAAPTAKIATGGYWLSADGAIYADHGHLFDHVNKFSDWPKPFRSHDGKVFLSKPWGENMVQRFYNQYESVFPIIDNLENEMTGLNYALKQADFPSSAAAVRKFFRFYLFQQSLAQVKGSLSKPDAQIGYNYDVVRQQPVDFFVEMLGAGQSATLSTFPADVIAAGFSPTTLSEEEIDALCAAKDTNDKWKRCPRRAGDLSAAAIGAIKSDEKRIIEHLRETLKRLANPSYNIAAVYVMGHTHRASPPVPLSLGEMPTGSFDVVHVNSGAFQRIASESQITALLSLNKHAGKSALDLQPEDLPACYNYVWIAPYKAGKLPVPLLLNWALNTESKFVARKGTCL